MLMSTATTTVPLIMLPNRRTARAMVREISPIILNGSMNRLGRVYWRR